MKRLLAPIVVLFLLLIGLPAEAANCFWVGGAATWNTANTASWASSTGGTGGTCAATGGIPENAADVAEFDANSGGGTVTVNANFTITEIILTGFTGTLDFSANNNNLTLSSATQAYADTSGTHTLNMGSGTWSVTCTGTIGTTCWNLTNASLTLSAASNTLNFTISTSGCSSNNNNGMTLALAGKTYGTVGFTNTSACYTVVTGANTFGHLNLTITSLPLGIEFASSVTQTISNAYTWTGTATAPIFITTTAAGNSTISSPAGSGGSWVAIRNTTSTSNTPTFNNCLNLGGLSSITCNAPVTGTGGGTLIGG